MDRSLSDQAIKRLAEASYVVTTRRQRLFPLCLVALTISFGILCITIKGSISTLHSPTSQGGINTLETFDRTSQDYLICQAGRWESYVCEGPKYDSFADQLEALLAIGHPATPHINSNSSIRSKSAEWGRRYYSPFPANTTLLAVGNSHTRQIFQTLHCQYESIQYFEPELNKTAGNEMRRGAYYYIEFLNHAKLHLVTNHALFYSRKWHEYLEDLVHLKLNDFDALVVGKINTFIDAYNTSFMELMIEKTSQMAEADFATVAPPTLIDFAPRFQGPIIAHSMMADWGNDYLNREMIEMVEEVDRPNVLFVNGREYVPLLGECSADVWDRVGECNDDLMAHRCIGQRGGHPDLIAWDILEALHDRFNAEEK